MSIFDKDIMQDESDLEQVRREEYIKKMILQMDVTTREINDRSKHSLGHYIVASEEMVKM